MGKLQLPSLIFVFLAFTLTAATQRPNIIVFLVDDYDKYETSVYGGKVLTPNLDRMAREGITFENAHVTSTVCTPSRYTFLTGRYASSSYCEEFLDLFPRGTQTLPGFNVELEDDNMNVGAVLAKHGYATGFVGKYHVGHGQAAKASGLHDVPKNVPYSDKINRMQFENEKRYRELIQERGFTWAKNIYWSNTKAPFQMHNPEWTIEAALEFVEAHKDGPFYLHYCTTLLHGPNGQWAKSLDYPEVTGEGRISYKRRSMPPRSTVMKRIRKAGLTENEAGYLWMDDSLGLLLDKLEELGISKDTLVLFTADHGSGNKGSLYKARGTEVPCIIRWPEGVRSVRCRELIQNTDFVPTWFDLAGAVPPKDYKIDGISLKPLFLKPNKPVRDHVFCEMGAARSIKTKEFSYLALRYTKEQVEGVRAGNRRHIKTMTGLSGGVSRSVTTHPAAYTSDQLFNLDQDSESKNNLADDPRYAKKLEDLKKQLTAELKRFPQRPFGEFVPGGNALPGGGYGDVFKTLLKASKEKKAKK